MTEVVHTQNIIMFAREKSFWAILVLVNRCFVWLLTFRHNVASVSGSVLGQKRAQARHGVAGLGVKPHPRIHFQNSNTPTVHLSCIQE